MSAEETPSQEVMVRQFADPPTKYGLYPNWWWEGDVMTREKVTWQVEQMKRVGSYGTFFYTRYIHDEPFALVPAYGTEEFYSLFRHALEEHRRLGMQMYFSEWTGAHPVADSIGRDPEVWAALSGRRLVLHEEESKGAGSLQIGIPQGEEVLSAAAYRVTPDGLDEGSRRDLTRSIEGSRLEWDAPEAGWLATVITSQRHGLDWTNPTVADRWLEAVWGPYLERMSEFIGNTFKGYVQDELTVLSGHIIYSPILLERFMAAKGYDPRLEMIALFRDLGPRTDKVRCDYFQIMAELLEENVYARLSRWHEDRNMLYGTVAVMGRQDALAQTNHFGDLFGLLRWYHFLGNEDPSGAAVPRRRRFIDSKLSSSAAHIFGRQRVALCAFWGSGWGAPMEQTVAWIKENYAYGINLYDPHGVVANLRGGWYEFVPPNYYFVQPYLEHYPFFSDFVRRLSYIMSQGVHRADVALLFPTTTLHANWMGGNRFALAADIAASAVYNMADSIYAGGVDFDFVDDRAVQDAEVQDGRLWVSGLEFRAVALPPMSTIRIETLRRLREFYDGGGIVLAYQRLPGASAEKGRGDPEVRALLEHIFGFPSSDGYEHQTFLPPLVVEDHFGSGIVVRRNERGGAAIFAPGQQNAGTTASVVDLPLLLRSVMTCDVSAPVSTHWSAGETHLGSTEDIYHTHQRIGDLDVYFVYNARPQARDVTLIFRVDGEPEVWDAFTGQVNPHHRFEPQRGTTSVRLRMERNQGVVLSFAQLQGRPSVVEDNLTDIVVLEPRGEVVEVRGLCANGGKKSVTVRHGGRDYRADARIEGPPEPVRLGGEWEFSLKPTMDNRWGDFRYPAAPSTLGAEARRFKYAEESEQAGTELGWHLADLADGHWPQYVYSFGPYWYTIGPFPEGQEPSDLLDRVVAGESPPGAGYEVAGQTFAWQRYDYSQLYGHESKSLHEDFGIQGVSDYFLVFDDLETEGDVSRYLVTTVIAEREGEWDLVFGGRGDFPRQAWVNGEQVLSTGSEEVMAAPEAAILPKFQQAPVKEDRAQDTEARVRVGLKEGANTVLLRLVQPRGRRVWAYAAFVATGANSSAGRPPVPRLRWFREATGLTYDILPGAGRPVGWYRFEAPPGARSITLALDALGVRAWVDGESVGVRDGRVELESPSDGVRQVALRVEQKPGCYAGAAIPEPVRFECGPTRMPLGDWCEYALETYSGGAKYSREFTLEPRHLEGRVIIDLGEVRTTAEVRVNGEVVGVCMARPNCLDITEKVRAGINRVEVTVYNTLANHYSVGIPSRYVFDGQTVSGLLGPVTLKFLAEVTLVARSV